MGAANAAPKPRRPISAGRLLALPEPELASQPRAIARAALTIGQLSKSEHTKRGYLSDLLAFCEWHPAGYELDWREITYADVTDFDRAERWIWGDADVPTPGKEASLSVVEPGAAVCSAQNPEPSGDRSGRQPAIERRELMAASLRKFERDAIGQLELRRAPEVAEARGGLCRDLDRLDARNVS